jgi:hypothetical protein
MPTIKRENDYVLGFFWVSSSDGSAFGRNHRSTGVTVYLAHSNESPIDSAIQFEAGKARTKKDAESLARKYIRENGLRERLATISQTQ